MAQVVNPNFTLLPPCCSLALKALKPRVDAYGGGAAFITGKEIKTMSTAVWLNEQIA